MDAHADSGSVIQLGLIGGGICEHCGADKPELQQLVDEHGEFYLCHDCAWEAGA